MLPFHIKLFLVFFICWLFIFFAFVVSVSSVGQ